MPRRSATRSPAAEVTDNGLQMGGIFYQRLIGSFVDGSGASNLPISMPLQFDGFMDARPNDRIRGFVDARLLYDPTRNQYSQTTGGNLNGELSVLLDSHPGHLDGFARRQQPFGRAGSGLAQA